MSWCRREGGGDGGLLLQQRQRQQQQDHSASQAELPALVCSLRLLGAAFAPAARAACRGGPVWLGSNRLPRHPPVRASCGPRPHFLSVLCCARQRQRRRPAGASPAVARRFLCITSPAMIACVSCPVCTSTKRGRQPLAPHSPSGSRAPRACVALHPGPPGQIGPGPGHPQLGPGPYWARGCPGGGALLLACASGVELRWTPAADESRKESRGAPVAALS
jgi:hypothetical protein